MTSIKKMLVNAKYSYIYFTVIIILASLMLAILVDDHINQQILLLLPAIFIVGLAFILFSIQYFDLFMFGFLVLIPLSRQLPYDQYISYGGTALMIMLYVSRKLLLRASWRKVDIRLAGAVILYLIVVLFSSFQSIYKTAGFTQLIREIGFFFVLYLLYDYLRTQRHWHIVVKSIIWSGLITVFSVLLSGVVSIINGRPILNSTHRLAGIFVNPSAAGLVISIAFPILIGYLQWQKINGNRHYQAKASLIFLLALLATLLTGSRSTLFEIIFVFIVLNWNEFMRLVKTKFLLIAGVFSIMVLFSLIFLSGSVEQQISSALRFDRGLSGRSFLWDRAWVTFKEFPILGTGPSTFRYYVLPSSKMAQFDSVDRIIEMVQTGEMVELYGWLPPGVFGGVMGNSAHNIWLNTAATMGIVGVFAVLLLFITFFRIGYRRLHFLRLHKDQIYYWIIRASMVGWIAFLLRTQFEEPGLLRGAIAENLMFWLTVLLVASSPKSLSMLLARANNKKRESYEA